MIRADTLFQADLSFNQILDMSKQVSCALPKALVKPWTAIKVVFSGENAYGIPATSCRHAMSQQDTGYIWVPICSHLINPCKQLSQCLPQNHTFIHFWSLLERRDIISYRTSIVAGNRKGRTRNTMIHLSIWYFQSYFKDLGGPNHGAKPFRTLNLSDPLLAVLYICIFLLKYFPHFQKKLCCFLAEWRS